MGCLFVPYGGMLFSPPTNPGSQTLGKVDLEDIFSGVVSTEEMATQSSILAWEIPWTEEPGGLQPMGHKESDTTE